LKLIIFEPVKKKHLGQNIKLQKIIIKRQKILFWIRDPGKPYSGSQGQEGTGSGPAALHKGMFLFFLYRKLKNPEPNPYKI
jgi:hypothetical protein